MNSNIPTSAVLHAAADAIQMAGWGKNADAWNADGGKGLCLEGGIAAAMGIEINTKNGSGLNALETCPAFSAVYAYLNADEPLPYGGAPWYFNDKIAETADDVIAVLRGAAEVEYLKEQTAAKVYETEDQPLPLDIAA